MSIERTEASVRLLRVSSALLPPDCTDLRDRTVDVCLEALEMAPDLPGGHPGRAARGAVLLLLADLCPEVPEPARRDLARICELLATTAALRRIRDSLPDVRPSRER